MTPDAAPAFTTGTDAAPGVGTGHVAFVRIYRWAAAALVLSAAVHTVTSGWDEPTFSLANFFSYFTVLSNLYAMVVLAVTGAWAGERLSHRWELARGASVLYMAMTGLVYAVLLSGVDVQTDQYTNWVMHRIVPLVVVLDWLYRPPRARGIDGREALVWLAFPFLYLVYTLVRGPIADWYPYPFMDPTRDGGYARVALNCVGVAVGFVAAAWLVARTPEWLSRRRRGRG